MASMTAIAGCLPRPVETADGVLTWKHVEPAIRPKVYYRAQTGLISLENTHNIAGGRVLPPAVQDEICDRAHERGIPVHLDAARIFNAATFLRRSVADIHRVVAHRAQTLQQVLLVFGLERAPYFPAGWVNCLVVE